MDEEQETLGHLNVSGVLPYQVLPFIEGSGVILPSDCVGQFSRLMIPMFKKIYNNVTYHPKDLSDFKELQ